jgi:hypothetical protein
MVFDNYMLQTPHYAGSMGNVVCLLRDNFHKFNYPLLLWYMHEGANISWGNHHMADK